ASYGGFVRVSVASMLGGKKPVTTDLAFKKVGPVKTTAGKKAAGPSQNKQVALEDVEVQQQVTEVISHIASTATKFLKICVVVYVKGWADISMPHAMKCLITFSKAMAPCFVKNVQDNERAQESKSS
ncbi:hypothetical protein Tco_0902025, partial [Tanacetum coccineum]